MRIGENSDLLEWRKNNFSGSLVVFEGCDGAGKTTQVRMLAHWLSSARRPVWVTKQPTDKYRHLPSVKHFIQSGGTVGAAEELLKLSAKDRFSHIEDEIVPRLESGCTVLCDRYVFSALAMFTLRGLPEHLIVGLHGQLLRPAVTIFLDVLPSVIFERLVARDGNRLRREENSHARLSAIRQSFLKYESYYTVVDGQGRQDEIHKSIQDLVRAQLSGCAGI